MAGALENIRILDLSQALAGPYCTMLLGDLGADVIKIERPGTGDQSRGWGPPFINCESAYFLSVNRNKRSLTLNLKTPAGQEILHRLVKTADVFICNLPRRASRQGMQVDEETLMGLNERLIYCLISGYGCTGPYAERPGYDFIAQGESGIMSITGEPDGPPVRYPISIANMVTGIYAAMGIITALFAREKNGRGQFLDMTLLESQTAWLAVQASGWMNAGLKPRRIGNAHACIVPYDVFKTEDKYIIVAVGTEKLWSNFCDSLGIEYLKDDPRFARNADRVEHREALMAILQEIFRTRPAEFWLTRLHEAGVPSGPINTVEDALNHPQHRARNFIVQLEHPALGPVWSLGNPLRLGDTPPTYRLPPPMLGQHTEEVLGRLGYGPAELESLRAQGVV